MSSFFKIFLVCISALTILRISNAQYSGKAQLPNSIKADFIKQGYAEYLTSDWGKDKVLTWEPTWNQMFAMQLEGKEVYIVPMIPNLEIRETKKPVKFKMVGARKYIVVSDFNTPTNYEFMTFIYDNKKNSDNGPNDKFISGFSGERLRQKVSAKRFSASKYEFGKLVIQSQSTTSSKNAKTLSTSGGYTCDIIVTCYWSAFCNYDVTTYGTFTTGINNCGFPFANAGPCYVTWDLVTSDSRSECHYDNPDIGADFPIGAVPSNRPCPGDPLVVNNIAASTSGNPGNIRGGTFGKGVRSNLDGTKKDHEGIDLEAEPGTTLYAAQPGKVVRIYKDLPAGKYAYRSYGNFIEIKNLDGTFYKYNHLDGIGANIYVGAEVNSGAVLGVTGKTGNAAKIGVVHKHLHLQMFDSRHQPIDPQPYLGTSFDMKTGKGHRPC